MSNAEADKESQNNKWVRPGPGSPCWINIPAADVSRARVFYENVFHWKFRDVNPGYPAEKFSAFTIPGSSVMGGISREEDAMKTEGRGKGGVVVYLMVDDVDVALETIIAAGGAVAMAKIREGDHTELAKFTDSEGNLVGILKWLI
jgi:predicted enzyme related to lactoylglutathione lyase